MARQCLALALLFALLFTPANGSVGREKRTIYPNGFLSDEQQYRVVEPKQRQFQTLATVNQPIELLLTESSYNLTENEVFLLRHPIKVTDVAWRGCASYEANLTLQNTLGTLHFWAGHGAASYSDGSHSIWIVGTLDQVNWALANVKYTPPTNFIGVDQLSVSVSDGGSCSNATASTKSGVINLVVHEKNDSPMLLLLGASGADQQTHLRIRENQDVTLNFGLFDNDVTNELEVNITVFNGHLTFNYSHPWAQSWTDTSRNLTWYEVGPTYYRVTGTQANLRNYLLTGIIYHPPTNVHSQFRKPGLGLWQDLGIVTVTVSDQGYSTFTLPGTNHYTVYFNMSSDITTCPCFMFDDLNITEDAGSVHWPILMYDTEYTIVEQMSVWVTARMTLSNGTLWFPTTTAAVTYDPVFNVWTLFGTETAVQRALNGTIFTPQPDFIGTSTLEIFVKDETRTGDLLQVFRNHTVYGYVHVIPINDPPRIIGGDTVYHFNRNMTLVFEDLSVYDPDASMTTDYMDIYISTESGQIVFPSDPLAIGAHNVTGNYQDMTSNITMRATLHQLNMLLKGMQYRSTTTWAEYITHIADNVHAVDYINITVNDNGYTGSGGPQMAYARVQITAYADLFPTCQSFIDIHRAYCGCYYIAYPDLLPINSTVPLFAMIPMDFPMRLYFPETAHRGFAQGCCQSWGPHERSLHFTKRYGVGLCANADFF
jgi:hypothetical protein|uniref:Uncharacterized protein n=1 Tax=Eutreptiella gymnastica TaxID=73025 RepID=A0A7S4D342_9EUGL|mmetsp:Transcript_88748/g.147450  ORF Transcript_88748/g.147450 Transcript_88748/m.147450 type:complete len:711 (-) Transcript_88748:888-3020(-)